MRQTGAVLGFLTGLTIVAWIGFGGPKPPASALPVSAANCSAPGDTQVVTSHPMTPDMTQDTPEYFYPYRISYAWTSAIGFLATVLMGVMAGLFTRGHSVSNISRVSGEAERLLRPAEAELDPALLALCVRPRPGGELRLSEEPRLEHKEAVC